MFRRLPAFVLLIGAAVLMVSVSPTGAQNTQKKKNPEVPAMPKVLMKLPRSAVKGAKFPAVDFHYHGRNLRTADDYKKLVADILDRIDQFEDFRPQEHYALTIADSELTRIERQSTVANDVDDIELDA